MPEEEKIIEPDLEQFCSVTAPDAEYELLMKLSKILYADEDIDTIYKLGKKLTIINKIIHTYCTEE